MATTTDLRVCHSCLLDVERTKAVCLHLHYADDDRQDTPFDQEFFYHYECFEKSVRLH